MKYEISKPIKSKFSPRYIVNITHNGKVVTFVSGSSVKTALTNAKEKIEDLNNEND